MRRGPVLAMLALAAGLAGLGVLVYQTSKGDAGLRARANAYLRDLKEIDAEWSLDVLRSKSEINKNYDPVSEPLRDVDKIQGTLGDLAKQIDATALRGPVVVLAQSFAEKVELIDNFKMQDSLLKNSLRFLPTAVSELKAQLQLMRESDGAKKSDAASSIAEIERIADATLTNVLRYDLSASPDIKAEVERLLSQLLDHSAALPEDVAAQAAVIVNHSRVVLQQKSGEDEVLAGIAKVATAGNIDRLADLFEKVFDANAQTQKRWRQGLIAYSSTLFAFLILAAWRLFESYRSLDQANSRLEFANSTLEDRVRERTSALSDALSNLKESQLQLVQAEKMASLGQMVAGVAHEINTPLAYVKSSVQVARARMRNVNHLVDESAKLVASVHSGGHENVAAANFEPLRKITAEFVETGALGELDVLLGDGLYGIEQISEIVLNLKNFSRLDRAYNDDFDINEGVESTLKIAHNIVKKRRIRKILGNVPAVRCSPSQVNQVLLNLITNACHATVDDTGTVAIVTRQHQDGVIVQVMDNGHGIPEEARTRIFDPFFTTKKVGEGTGLGLSIVHNIVKEHGGWITVSSQVGKGTLFTVYLPRSQPSAPSPGEPGISSPRDASAYQHQRTGIADEQLA